MNRANIATNSNDIAFNRQSINTNTTNIASNSAAIGNNSVAISDLNGEFQGFTRDASAGIAGASSFVDTSSGIVGTTFALGAASYNSEQALSANVGYTPKKNTNWDLFAGVALNSSGSDIYRAGFRYRFGQKRSESSLGSNVLSKRNLSKLQNSVDQYQDIVKTQADQIESLTQQNQEILLQLQKLSAIVAEQQSKDASAIAGL